MQRLFRVDEYWEDTMKPNEGVGTLQTLIYCRDADTVLPALVRQSRSFDVQDDVLTLRDQVGRTILRLRRTRN